MRGFCAGPEGRCGPGGREDRARDAAGLEQVGDLDEVVHRACLLLGGARRGPSPSSSGPRSRTGRPSGGRAAPAPAGPRASASSGVSAPARCMPVSTSTRIPSVVPASTRHADRASASPTSSTLTRTFASRASSAAARRLCGSTSWFAISTSSAPARTITMASQTVAAQIPNAPCSSCSRATCGLLWFLTCPRRRAWSDGQPRLHVRQVRQQVVAVDDQGRRHDVVLALADRRPVEVADAVVGLGDDRRRVPHRYTPRSSMSSSQRDSGPRGRTGHTSTTWPSSIT